MSATRVSVWSVLLLCIAQCWASSHPCTTPTNTCSGTCLFCPETMNTAQYCFPTVAPAKASQYECCGCRNISNSAYCTACPSPYGCQASQNFKFRCGPSESRILGPLQFDLEWISPQDGAMFVEVLYGSQLAHVTTLSLNQPINKFNLIIGTMRANATLSIEYIQSSLPPVVYIDVLYENFQQPKVRYVGFLGGVGPLPPCGQTSTPSAAVSLNLGAVVLDIWTFGTEYSNGKVGAALVRTSAPQSASQPVGWHIIFPPPSGLPKSVDFILQDGLEFTGTYSWMASSFHVGGLVCNRNDCKELKKSTQLSVNAQPQCSFM